MDRNLAEVDERHIQAFGKVEEICKRQFRDPIIDVNEYLLAKDVLREARLLYAQLTGLHKKSTEVERILVKRRKHELADAGAKLKSLALEYEYTHPSRSERWRRRGLMKKTWQITDFERVPLERLRPYFDVCDVEMAVDGAIKAGMKHIEGVRILTVVDKEWK